MRLGNFVALLGVALLAAGCDLDVSNPNALPENEVLSTPDGILALAVGMQDLFAEDVEELIQASALVTDEWGTGTSSLPAYRALLTGESIDEDLGVVEEPWAAAYSVVNAANDLIANAPNVGIAPAGAATGVVALARLFKAMSLGMISLQYERIVLHPEVARLEPREVVMDTVLALLEAARAEVGGLAPADLTFLESRVYANGLDVPSTIDAMLARYYLIDGQYQQAITAAERVDLGVTSVLPFTAPDVNPICNLSQCGFRYTFPLASFALQAEPGDQRPAFWVDVAAAPITGNPDSLLLPLAMYGERTDPFLVYVPDEMTLIRAEAYARLGNLPRARELVNEVRTRTTVQPVAGLPALPDAALDTQAEILAQIAHERRYELYEQGLRWEDVRRLGEFVDEVPTTMWLPLPRQECANNPGLC